MSHKGKPRSILIPVVSAVVSLLLFLSISVAVQYLLINQNNQSQHRVEQQAIAAAIASNNKDLCDVVVTINKSAKGSSNSNNRPNSYTLRLRQDFIGLADKYKCGY